MRVEDSLIAHCKRAEIEEDATINHDNEAENIEDCGTVVVCFAFSGVKGRAKQTRGTREGWDTLRTSCGPLCIPRNFYSTQTQKYTVT